MFQQGTVARWRLAKMQAGIIVGIVGSLLTLDWFLGLFFSLPVASGIINTGVTLPALGGIALPAIVLPFGILVLVLIAVELLYGIFRLLKS